MDDALQRFLWKISNEMQNETTAQNQQRRRWYTHLLQFFSWLAVRIPNNNEGSNANEFISMQFKSISSCITFHTVRNHSYSYSHSIYVCLLQSLSSIWYSVQHTAKTEIYCISSQFYDEMIFIFKYRERKKYREGKGVRENRWIFFSLFILQAMEMDIFVW